MSVLTKLHILSVCSIILLVNISVSCLNRSLLDSLDQSTYNIVKPQTIQIPHRLTYGDTVSILGKFLPSCKQIDISFMSSAESQDIALLISFKMDERKVLRNSYVNGVWGQEETSGGFPITDDGMFDLTVYFFDDFYHIVIAADHFCRYPVRLPLSHTNVLVVVGLSELEKVVWDQGCKCP